MAPAALVMVHGGQHTKECWQPTLDAISKKAPQAKRLAVNLPGHGSEAGDLAKLTITQCVESVVQQIDDAGFDEVVLLGHSMAGITLPGVLTRLGSSRVRRMIYLSCCIPPQGKRVVDTLQLPMNIIAILAAKFQKISPPLPGSFAMAVFGNGMTRSQKNFNISVLTAESTGVTMEPVDRSKMPRIPTTWILLQRDRALRPALQHRFIANLGGVDEIVPMDTCHSAMISRPDELADILLARL